MGILKIKSIYSTGDNSHPYAISMGDFNNDDRDRFRYC